MNVSCIPNHLIAPAHPCAPRSTNDFSVGNVPYSTKSFYRHVVLASAAILMLLVSWATESRTAFADETTAPNEMEEVTVYGEKSVLKLKRALVRAENHVFSVFNALNPDYQYDIQCHKRVPLGSHIPQRLCYPNFVDDLEWDAASVWKGSGRRVRLDGGQIIVSETKMKEKAKNLRDIMEALKLEHPELAEALGTYNEAKHRYVTASEKK